MYTFEVLNKIFCYFIKKKKKKKGQSEKDMVFIIVDKNIK